jgi:hypothetical protein
VAKICEVQGKAAQVEAKWGPLSLKTGRAHFLLHHACRHPQAAPLFAEQAEQALRRALGILQYNSQLGLAGGQAADYQSLLEGIQGAAAGAAAGAASGAVGCTSGGQP